jgi:hypothetical protein
MSPYPGHLPKGAGGKVKGDDSYHTCVITSVMGLAYPFLNPSPPTLLPVLKQFVSEPSYQRSSEGSGT